MLADATLRQTVQVSVGGRRLRLRFSNAFGGAVLPITAVTVALPVDGRAGVSAIQPGTIRQVTFNGRASVNVPVGALVGVRPARPSPCAPGTNLTVTAYLADAARRPRRSPRTPAPAPRRTCWRATTSTPPDLPGATPTDHWYFLSGVEVRARTPPACRRDRRLADRRPRLHHQRQRPLARPALRPAAARARQRRRAEPGGGRQPGPQRRPRPQRPGPAGPRPPGTERRPVADRVRGRQRHRHGRAERGRPEADRRRPDRRLPADRRPRPRARHPGLRRDAPSVRRQRLRRPGRHPRGGQADGEPLDPHQPPLRRGHRLRRRRPRPGRAAAAPAARSTSATTCT